MPLRPTFRWSRLGMTGAALSLVCLAAPHLAASAKQTGTAAPTEATREAKRPPAPAPGPADPPAGKAPAPFPLRMKTAFPGSGDPPRYSSVIQGQLADDELENLLESRPCHPFFAVQGDERRGKMMTLLLATDSDRTEQPPRQLSVDKDTNLWWGCDSGLGYQMFTKVGSHHTWDDIPSPARHYLPADGGVWIVGENLIAFGTDQGIVHSMNLPRPLGKGSQRPVASDGDDLFLPLPGEVLRFHLDRGGPGGKPVLKATRIPGTEETRDAKLMPNRAGNVLVHAPDQPFLYVRRVGAEAGAVFATANDGIPVCLARGTGAEVWFIQNHPFGYGCIDTENMRIEHFQPRGQAVHVKEPCAATFAPDGNLWFTDREGCRIGRITRHGQYGEPAGTVTLFDLGEGRRPEEIVCSRGAWPREGWLFCTIQGEPMILSLRAVDAPPREAAELPGAEADAAAWEAAPRKRRLSGAERRKRRQAALAQPQAGVPAAAPARPWDAQERLQVRRLEALSIRVTPGRMAHILDRHAEESKGDGGKFKRQYSTRKDLLKLFADALHGVEIGNATRIGDANCYTTCTWPRTGAPEDQGADSFILVTHLMQDESTGRSWQNVVTAFPR